MIMSKSNISSNPLQVAYQGLEEALKVQIRSKVMEQADISMPQFYVIIRNGRAKKLQRKVFSKVFGLAESVLFPQPENL